MNLDLGHFHCEENVSDKISAVMLFSDRFMAHLTRGIRWDSDHVVLNDEKTQRMMHEIVRCGVLDQAFIGTDYFDASINRVAAWTIGTRATKKALLAAMLEPVALLWAGPLAFSVGRMLLTDGGRAAEWLRETFQSPQQDAEAVAGQENTL